jgi:hypothetical protein
MRTELILSQTQTIAQGPGQAETEVPRAVKVVAAASANHELLAGPFAIDRIRNFDA